MQSYKSTLFLAPQYIQSQHSITYDFESKKIYGNRCRSNDPPKKIKNVLKMKAKYKEKALQK